jgi:flagellar FliJ protein
MSFQFRMEKILDVRVREKQTLQGHYQKAVETFEETATMLYEMLRKKEELEEKQSTYLTQGGNMEAIHQFQRYAAILSQQIDTYQKKVLSDRSKMESAQQELMDKSVDVKKYERLKSRQYEVYKSTLNEVELKTNDELSIFRYHN